VDQIISQLLHRTTRKIPPDVVERHLDASEEGNRELVNRDFCPDKWVPYMEGLLFGTNAQDLALLDPRRKKVLTSPTTSKGETAGGSGTQPPRKRSNPSGKRDSESESEDDTTTLQEDSDVIIEPKKDRRGKIKKTHGTPATNSRGKRRRKTKESKQRRSPQVVESETDNEPGWVQQKKLEVPWGLGDIPNPDAIPNCRDYLRVHLLPRTPHFAVYRDSDGKEWMRVLAIQRTSGKVVILEAPAWVGSPAIIFRDVGPGFVPYVCEVDEVPWLNGYCGTKNISIPTVLCFNKNKYPELSNAPEGEGE